MFHQLHPEFHLAEVRERHSRLRQHAEHARAFREARGQHRYRFRQRRP